MPPHCLLDGNSIYHNAHSITLQFTKLKKSDINPHTKLYDFNSTELNKTKFALLDVQPQLISNSDCEYYYTTNETNFVLKITQFTDAIKHVQNKFTSFKKQRKSTKAHQWTKHITYSRLVKKLKATKRTHIANPTLQSKSDLRLAHIETYK